MLENLRAQINFQSHRLGLLCKGKGGGVKRTEGQSHAIFFFSCFNIVNMLQPPVFSLMKSETNNTLIQH